MIYETLYTITIIGFAVALVFAIRKIYRLQQENVKLRELIDRLKYSMKHAARNN